jgi:hypothetical protein
VNDLVPYLRHADYSDEQMKEIWARVTIEELAALKAYIAANFNEVMAENDRIDERIAREIEAQNNNPVLQAKLAESHKRFHLFKQWFAEWKKKPELYIRNPDDSPEEHRARMFAAFDTWRAVRTAGATKEAA